jgi:DNA-binding response OmpR family regulator
VKKGLDKHADLCRDLHSTGLRFFGQAGNWGSDGMNGRPAILIVEDNADIFHQTSKILSRNGYAVTMAASLSEAREQLPAAQPDLILLDNHLPDGKWLDFMRELRESEHADIPILLLTGLGAKEDVVRGLTAGGDDYLTKPYNFSELLARVQAPLQRDERIEASAHLKERGYF